MQQSNMGQIRRDSPSRMRKCRLLKFRRDTIKIRQYSLSTGLGEPRAE